MVWQCTMFLKITNVIFSNGLTAQLTQLAPSIPPDRITAAGATALGTSRQYTDRLLSCSERRVLFVASVGRCILYVFVGGGMY